MVPTIPDLHTIINLYRRDQVSAGEYTRDRTTITANVYPSIHFTGPGNNIIAAQCESATAHTDSTTMHGAKFKVYNDRKRHSPFETLATKNKNGSSTTRTDRRPHTSPHNAIHRPYQPLDSFALGLKSPNVPQEKAANKLAHNGKLPRRSDDNLAAQMHPPLLKLQSSHPADPACGYEIGYYKVQSDLSRVQTELMFDELKKRDLERLKVELAAATPLSGKGIHPVVKKMRSIFPKMSVSMR